MKPSGHMLLAFSLLVTLEAGVAGAQTKINGCTTITASGSYVLSKDITASNSDLISNGSGLMCIAIAADFVTLDMAGHTITGPGPGNGADGIGTDHFHVAITVRSGSVTNFDNNGIVLNGAGLTVEHVRAIGNGNRGIDLGHAPSPLVANGHRVVGNIALSNGIGIQVVCPAVVLQNVAEKNTPPPVGGDIIAIGVGCTMADNSPPP